MDSFVEELEKIETFFLDMDGVVIEGNRLIEGSKKAIQELRRKGKKLVFLTNGSTKTRGEYRRKFLDLGLDVKKSEIMTSAYATAIYLAEKTDYEAAYVLGEDGFKKELEGVNIRIVSEEKASEAPLVLVGTDRGLNYDKIRGGMSALLNGAEFIAAHSDSTYPTERGLAPAAGACIGALAGSTGREPSMVIGKPSPYMINLSLDRIGSRPERAAIVGDRADTDVQAGINAGIKTILVLTGISSRGDVEDLGGGGGDLYVFSSLASLLNSIYS